MISLNENSHLVPVSNLVRLIIIPISKKYHQYLPQTDNDTHKEPVIINHCTGITIYVIFFVIFICIYTSIIIYIYFIITL